MGTLVYNSTFTEGQTLRAAQLEEFKTEIAAVLNDGVDAANVTDGTLTPAKLTAPNALYSILVKPVNSIDSLSLCTTNPIALAEFITATPGVDHDQNTLNTHFQVPVDSTIIGISVGCRTSTQGVPTTRNNSARLFVDTTGVDSAVTFTTGDVVNSGAFSQAVTTTQALEIRVATDSAATHGVSDPHVWVHCVATHQA